MVYISNNGNVSAKNDRRWSISGLLRGIFDFFGLLIGSITQQPERLRNATSTTYTQRQGVRQPTSGGRGGARLGGAKTTNIRGVTKGGSSDCAVGGG
eukprot:CAMPEP_0198275670 /NCGR_PEP_ID=MMETSP1447-20131203/64901_1 /TAXON_ID=420782 /ORGANISM="Chaetoceros dichaeta, Strain CCMP1751" /LENGTH=96 /DNA_ID=CAMNT_0043970559 /DNA_START=495 /DNA_END=785 /DNA_ORIENTATION=-